MNWKDYVQTDEKYIRPNEVNHLLGDSSKARKSLNWSPETSFQELVEMMVHSDVEKAEQEKILLEKNLIHNTWEKGNTS